jgi:hypothetical protein
LKAIFSIGIQKDISIEIVFDDENASVKNSMVSFLSRLNNFWYVVGMDKTTGYAGGL